MNARALVMRTLRRASAVAATVIASRMNAEVRIERLAPEAVLDPVTGVLDYERVQVVYEGPAHVGPRTGSGSAALGGETVTMFAVRVSIPLSAEQPRDNDQVTVLEHFDPAWVGAVYTLVDAEVPGAVPGMRVLHGQGIQPNRRTVEN